MKRIANQFPYIIKHFFENRGGNAGQAAKETEVSRDKTLFSAIAGDDTAEKTIAQVAHAFKPLCTVLDYTQAGTPNLIDIVTAYHRAKDYVITRGVLCKKLVFYMVCKNM